ncbi:MAG TPA: 4Fe-4S dicluster domain-containing protein [Dehalococcoidales bacterium]|nr:4Fe-4S dicluster domain-containing protein [Dehalococcoidales bacterium]
MVVDLSKCMRCHACIAACRVEHFLPLGMTWPRLIAWEENEAELTTFPVRCNHCQDAPCVKVCPTGATQQREDGIVWVDQDRCVGCRYCIIACPYQNRTYLSRDRDTGYFPGYEMTEFEKVGRKLYPHTVGTTEKCNFCMERIDEGISRGLKPGKDRAATPACVNTCPSRALHFGDLDDPDSEVRQLIRDRRGFQLHLEHDTDPSIYYIDKGYRGA